MRKFIQIAERVCLTPGAFYDTHISDQEVEVSVKLPPEVTIPDMTDEQAQELEDKLHDALEEIVAELIDDLDPDAQEHWDEARKNDLNEAYRKWRDHFTKLDDDGQPRLRGPHSGSFKEQLPLTLMLAGKKPMAWLDENELLMQRWQDAIRENGWLVSEPIMNRQSIHGGGAFERTYVVALPGHEARMNLFRRLLEKREAEGRGWTDVEHAKVGLLLGYSPEAVRAFLAFK